MKLNQLTINRLPGIDQRISITAKDAGIYVIFGPNGIGKSSLCRAVEALYWQEHGGDRETSLNAEFELNGTIWRVEREGSDLRWRHGDGEQATPRLPPSHAHRSFFLRLRDLIDPEQDSGDVAREIQRQLSGGLDSNKVVSGLFSRAGPRYGRHEHDQFQDIRKNIDARVGEQAELRHNEDRLDGLSQELEEAQAQADKIIAVDRAKELAESRQKHEDVQGQLDALPHSLSRLTGHEADRVREHLEQIDKFNKQFRLLQQKIESAQDTAAGTGLDAPIATAKIDAWRENADELKRIEVNLKTARKELETRRGELNAALAAIGGGDVDQVALDTDAHAQLFDFLRDAESHRTEESAIRSKMNLLESVEEEALDAMQRECEQMRDATNLLRDWLRAGDDTQLTMNKSSRFWLIVVLVATAVCGILGALYNSVFWLASVGALAAIGLLFRRDKRKTPSERDTARNAFIKLDIDAPSVWEIDEVGQRLAMLEDGLSSLTVSLQRARADASFRRDLANQLESLDKAGEHLARRRQSLMEELNLRELRADAELVDFARALDNLRAAEEKAEGASSQVKHLEEQFATLFESLANDVERYGGAKPGDTALTTTIVNELAKRTAQLDRALSDEQEAKDELDNLSLDLESEHQAKKEIYASVSLVDDDAVGLADLIRMHPQYNELKNSLTSLDSEIARDQKALAKMGAADLVDKDATTLDLMHDEFKRKVQRLEELRNEIAEIKTGVEAAKQSDELEQRLKSLEAARDRLRERLNEALFDEAGKFLVGLVEREYEKDHMPAVFQRARDHFDTFTRHRYKLQIAKHEGTSRLTAIDLGNGKEQELAELSDGTRAQLLLASRLAHAEELEHGEPMPLFLDEALDQSDPERFEVIVRSLGCIAREQDRQIFYLTSDPLDVDRMQHALAKDDLDIVDTINLGLIRRDMASTWDASALAFRTGEPIPSPGDMSAEDYAKVLGVPVFNPMRGYDGQHLYYLLPDALPLLQELLCGGIEFAGQWQTVADTGFVGRIETDLVPPQQITHRVQLLEIFCTLWHQGRGRSIDRDVLSDSGAVTSTYFEALVEITRELHGDAARVLEVIDGKQDERIKGFRTRNRESLNEYLREHGYIDDEEPLSQDALRTAALASPAASGIPGTTAIDLLNNWWSWAVLDEANQDRAD